MGSLSQATPLPFTASTQTVQVVVQCTALNARIYLDNKELGGAGELLTMAPGLDYHLVVRAPYHLPQSLFLPCLVPGDPPIDLPVRLTPQPASLLLTAKSPNRLRKIPTACVQLNDLDLGEVALPYETNGLAPGDYTISLQAHEYKKTHPQTVRLKPGRLTRLNIELTYEESSFRFGLEPTNATVLVGAETVSNGEIHVVPNRIYSVQVSAPGYHTARFNDAAMPGEARCLTIRLTPRTFIRFDLTPPDAVVFMQGRRLTERVVEVKADTTYLLEVRAPGYEPRPVSVCLKPGETRTINVQLERKGLW
jgi:hypothetical protein